MNKKIETEVKISRWQALLGILLLNFLIVAPVLLMFVSVLSVLGKGVSIDIPQTIVGVFSFVFGILVIDFYVYLQLVSSGFR